MSDHRKMVLLEAAEVERMRQKQLREYDPTITAMARAQAQLEAILVDSQLSDEDKVTLIDQLHNKFKNLKAAIGPIEAVQPVTVAVSAAEPTAPAAAAASTATGAAAAAAADEIERELDPAYHKDYQTLKSLIDKNPQLIRVNRKGELMHKDRTIPGTSFKDIIIAVLTGKDVSTTHGVDKFVKGVQGMHITKKSFSSPHIGAHLFLPSTPSPRAPILPTPGTLNTNSPSVRLQNSPPPSQSAMRRSNRTSKRISFQTGTGRSAPPGKRPRILFLYH